MTPKKFVIVADNHGDQIHRPTEKKFFEFLADFKPHVRVHLGDNWDFSAIRSGASDADRAANLEADWAEGESFLRRFFQGGETNVFLRGNHDERIFRLLTDPCSGVVRDYARRGCEDIRQIAKDLKVRMLPYDSRKGVYKLGNLSCLHGYHAGMHAAAQHARIYGESVFGHVHTFDSSPVAGLTRKVSRSIGCLARHDMSYCSSQTGKLRWAHGWAYGWVYPNGRYQLFEAESINGQFHVASEVKSY
jgi:hypothetical protein